MSEWSIPEPDQLRVHVDGIDAAGPRSTVTVGLGTTDDGRRVVFAGGTAEMRRIGEALDAGMVPVAYVPTWAILSASLPGPVADEQAAAIRAMVLRRPDGDAA